MKCLYSGLCPGHLTPPGKEILVLTREEASPRTSMDTVGKRKIGCSSQELNLNFQVIHPTQSSYPSPCLSGKTSLKFRHFNLWHWKQQYKMTYVNLFSSFMKSDVTPISYRLSCVQSLEHENIKFLSSIVPLCTQQEQRSKKVQNKDIMLSKQP